VNDVTALRRVLDRLGDPEDIVAAARSEDPSLASDVPAIGYRRPGIGREIAAVMLLTVGSVIPLIGWLAGVILLWSSSTWKVGEKVLATLVVPGGPFGLLVLGGGLFAARACPSSSSLDSNGMFTQGPETCSGFALPPWLGLSLLAVALIAPFVVGGVLLQRASARAKAEGA
jgi:hypothetical protein